MIDFFLFWFIIFLSYLKILKQLFSKILKFFLFKEPSNFLTKIKIRFNHDKNNFIDSINKKNNEKLFK